MTYTATTLFQDGLHKCLMYSDRSAGEGVQSNQFLIEDANDFALLDPGGDLTYSALSLEIARHHNLSDLRYIFASHQDPDVIASLDRWLLHTHCNVVAPRVWARFLPHLASDFANGHMDGSVFDRIIAVPDEGMIVPFGSEGVVCLPAHFLHSVGNIQFYDPVSRILFSGDVGASMGYPLDESLFVEDMTSHIEFMKDFHQRYLCSNKVCRFWVDMVRQLDEFEMIVPQHGKVIRGSSQIEQFLNWLSQLECGIDLMEAGDYSIPLD